MIINEKKRTSFDVCKIWNKQYGFLMNHGISSIG